MRLRGSRVAIGGLAAICAIAVSGCGSSSSGGGSVAPAAGTNAALGTQSTSIGTVTTAASNGHTAYVLVGNDAANAMCGHACEQIWPPVTSGGKIVVLHGRPLFTFAGDTAAGQTKGQNVKDTWGTWLAVSSTGQPISATTTASSSPSSSGSTGGSGGYGY